MLACAAFCVSADAAHAARHALLIGANRGQAGDATLKFAITDAERLAEVLETQGGFLPQNTTVLRQPNANELRSAIGAINARIRQEVDDSERVLLVFYSGHADATAVHLGETPLPWNELRDLTVGSSAQTRLLIVDACRSGVATRVKGVTVAQPFALPRALEEVPDGFAVLSSAAAGESAQESDSISSSFFTFHLAAALAGLGDRDGDGSVTLSEAFDYTSDRTMASTAATLAGIQHPTYRYELKGRTSFVLTRPAAAQGRLVKVTMQTPGVYLWRQSHQDGRLILEANVANKGRTVWLAAGSYHLQRRGRDRFYEAHVTLANGEAIDTSTLKYRAIGYDQLVRKGGRQDAGALGLRGGYARPIVEGYTAAPLFGLRFTYARAFANVEVGLETSAARAVLPGITGNLRNYATFLGLSRSVDLAALSFALGVRGGAILSSQRFDADRAAPSRSRLLPFVGMFASATLNVPWAFYLAIEAALEVTRSQLEDNNGLQRTDEAVLPRLCAEIGRRF